MQVSVSRDRHFEPLGVRAAIVVAWLLVSSDLGCMMQDYPKLDKFKDALKQAAQTITSIKVVFADATVNSGVLAAFPSSS